MTETLALQPYDFEAGGDVPGCVEDVTYAPRTR